MALTTYTELKASVAVHLHRTDMTSIIPELIGLGEARLNRLIVSPAMDAVESYSSASRNLALPTRFLASKALYRFDAGDPVQLVQLDHSRFDSVATDATTGTPEYFMVSDHIYLNIAPSSTTSYSFRYVKNLNIATDETNWLLTKYPDAYLYASLMAAAPHVKDKDSLSIWSDMLSQAISEINNTETHSSIRLMCDPVISSRGGFDIISGN